jgi:hypothetical protein
MSCKSSSFQKGIYVIICVFIIQWMIPLTVSSNDTFEKRSDIYINAFAGVDKIH